MSRHTYMLVRAQLRPIKEIMLVLLICFSASTTTYYTILFSLRHPCTHNVMQLALLIFWALLCGIGRKPREPSGKLRIGEPIGKRRGQSLGSSWAPRQVFATCHVAIQKNNRKVYKQAPPPSTTKILNHNTKKVSQRC